MARHDDRGAVTAETAMALPLLAVLALSLAWLVTLGATQVRVIDAAREVARSAARSDGPGPAVALGRRVAPSGSRVTVTVGGGEVRARVTSPVTPPLGLFGSWARIDLHAEALAAQEPVR
ncbi:MAG: hypothetical protein JWR42_1993 [Marmoricola sp.]|nr:hypothetical protein [Marmoricola sp.]